MWASERMKRVCGASLEELRRVVGRYTHPLDEPVALGLLAAVRGGRSAGLHRPADEDMRKKFLGQLAPDAGQP
jgi:hypothetical protein